MYPANTVKRFGIVVSTMCCSKLTVSSVGCDLVLAVMRCAQASSTYLSFMHAAKMPLSLGSRM